jgi:hypothetical protein
MCKLQARTVVVVLLVTICCAPCALGVSTFSDDFVPNESALWGNDYGSWGASGGVYQAGSPSTYPNARSLLPYALTDFEFEVDINDVSDGGIWARATNAPGTSVGATGVLFVTAHQKLYWHIVPTGSGYSSMLSETSTGLYNTGDDISIRLTVSGNTYSAYLNGSAIPATTLTTTQFSQGQVGLYDYSGQTFDNVKLTVIPEPASLGLVALGMVGLGVLQQRRRKRGNP